MINKEQKKYILLRILSNRSSFSINMGALYQFFFKAHQQLSVNSSENVTNFVMQGTKYYIDLELEGYQNQNCVSKKLCTTEALQNTYKDSGS